MDAYILLFGRDIVIAQNDFGDMIDQCRVVVSFDADIVFGKAMHFACCVGGLFPEHTTYGADMSSEELGMFFAGDFYQLGGAMMFIFLAHFIAEEESLGAGALGVREDMELIYIEATGKFAAFLPLFGSFAAGSGYDIDADECIGDNLAYMRDAVAEEGGIVATVHQFEHAVGTRLQGYMEVWHKSLGLGGDPVDNLMRDEVWFYR